MKRIFVALQMVIASALLLTSPGLPGIKAVLTGASVRGSGLQVCSLSLAPPSVRFPGEGGVGSFVVATPAGIGYPECPFQATPTVSWLTVSNMHPKVDFRVAANTGQARVGSIAIVGPDGTGPVFVVEQSAAGCVTSISPQGRVVDNSSTMGTIDVAAPADCFWSARTDADWLGFPGISQGSVSQGPGTVTYHVEHNDGAPRTATIEIGGRVFGVHQNSDCPLEFLCASAPGACTDRHADLLTLSRRYRDDVLAGAPTGRRYTQLYYQFSSEAVHVMAFNPMLILRAGEIAQRYKPLLRSMASGETITLTTGDLDEIDGFLDSFAARGSAELRNAIQGLRQDIRDPHVHSDLRISVIDGPRREMPVPEGKHGI